MTNAIVERFGRRRQQELPTLRPGSTPSANESAQALAFINSLNDEVQHLRDENARLRADLNLCKLRCADLETERRVERAQLEQYRRYAVEVKTYLQTVVDAANRANDRALDAGNIDHAEQQALANQEPNEERAHERDDRSEG